jgi:hypothetical protein
MLLNGPQLIDVKDWKENTMYKGYRHNDHIITWFWTIVFKYDQKKLANLLHYCTGSNRVPILGFKYLESNRNTVHKFTIEKVGVSKTNPYPRSYTGFNRLELPEYSSMSELEKNLNVVLNQEITHFGLN